MSESRGGMLARGFAHGADFPWPLSRSSELFELRYGKSLVEKNRRHGRVPVYGTNGRCGWHDLPNFSGPGVILGRKGQGPLGVKWCQTDYWVIDTAYSLRLLRDDLDLRYCYYLIDFVGLNQLKDGTSNPSLSRDTFGAQLFPIPSLKEQIGIASVLQCLDDKIELNRHMAETLEAMARALFKDWFVDFGPTRMKLECGEPYLALDIWGLFPDKLDDEDKPAGWVKKKLEDLTVLVKGRSYKSEELRESVAALVTLKSFQRGGGYRHDGLKSFAGKYKVEQVVTPGELVVALTDVTQSADVIGKPAIVGADPSFETLVASLDVGILRPSKEDIRLPYLYCLLRTEEFQNHIYGHCTGTTVLHLSKEGIPSFELRVPPSKLLSIFDSFSKPLFSRIAANQEESLTLAQTRDLLLPKLMSGEIRIRDAESAVAPVL